MSQNAKLMLAFALWCVGFVTANPLVIVVSAVTWIVVLLTSLTPPNDPRRDARRRNPLGAWYRDYRGKRRWR